MKGGNSDTNGYDLNKNKILKLTFDTLMKEGHKSFETYHTDLEDLFLSCCEATWQGTDLRDTTPIVFRKPKVMPVVWSDPSPSRNDIQSMINYVLEMQAKNTDELLRRSIEEWDSKKLDATSINPSFSSSFFVSFAQTNPHMSGTLAGGTTMSNPSAPPVNHFHSQTTINGSTPTFRMSQQTTTSMFGQGYMQTAPSFSLPNITSAPYTPKGNG
jgi:hypothetical protein